MTSSTPDALWASKSVRTLKPAAVVCEGVTRRWRGQRLLDDLTLVVGVGARLLVVSRPEQSASMLLRVLAGLSRMHRGTVRLAGVARPDSSAAGWARRVGYVGPEAGIYPWMTPREVLDLAGRIAEYEPKEIQRRIDRVAEAIGSGSTWTSRSGAAASPWRSGSRWRRRCSPILRSSSSTSRCGRSMRRSERGC